MSNIDMMIEHTQQVMQNSYAPYSNYNVGACIKTTNGHYYSGCNIENASYSLTLCAEATAIACMLAAGDREISEIMVMGSTDIPCAPCGACRQRLHEFAKPNTLVHICSQQGVHKTIRMDELLPEAFGSHTID